MLGGGKVCGIGMQVNTDGYGCMALDINHDILRHEWVDADMSGVEPDVVFGKLDAMAKAMAEDLESKRCIIAGVSCALPGLVTSEQEACSMVPQSRLGECRSDHVRRYARV